MVAMQRLQFAQNLSSPQCSDLQVANCCCIFQRFCKSKKDCGRYFTKDLQARCMHIHRHQIKKTFSMHDSQRCIQPDPALEPDFHEPAGHLLLLQSCRPSTERSTQWQHQVWTNSCTGLSASCDNVLILRYPEMYDTEAQLYMLLGA